MGNQSEAGWVWMGHAAHFICAHQCQFRLATYLPSGFVVSSVGEMDPPKEVRKITGTPDGQFEQIGYNRLYETFVFRANQKPDKCGCYRIADGCEIDLLVADDSKEATDNHYKLCRKWAKMEADDGDRDAKDLDQEG